MDKRKLKNYLKNNRKELLQTSCFKYGNSYLITDSYSIIKINNSNDLTIKNDNFGLKDYYKNFKNNFEVDYILPESILKTEKESEPIKDDFSINIKLFKKIKAIIKADKFVILKNKNSNMYMNYVIELINTTTKENAYLLPMKVY